MRNASADSRLYRNGSAVSPAAPSLSRILLMFQFLRHFAPDDEAANRGVIANGFRCGLTVP
jgi:hypothetical protein